MLVSGRVLGHDLIFCEEKRVAGRRGVAQSPLYPTERPLPHKVKPRPRAWPCSAVQFTRACWSLEMFTE